jgi:hypothetical protein
MSDLLIWVVSNMGVVVLIAFLLTTAVYIIYRVMGW